MYPCSSYLWGLVVVAVRKIKLIRGSQLATPICTVPLKLNVDTPITSRLGWFFYGHKCRGGGGLKHCFRITST